MYWHKNKYLNNEFSNMDVIRGPIKNMQWTEYKVGSPAQQEYQKRIL